MAEEIIGRDAERASVMQFLTPVAGPAALIIGGEAGIGKTALWKEAVSAARGMSFRVLLSRPGEQEHDLSYSVLGDLIGPVLDETLPFIPEPQAEALEVALLRRRGLRSRPDHHAVSLAALGVIRNLPGAEPVLVAVDDVQWVDAASRRVLQFMVRRLRDERVAFLLAQRGVDRDEDPFRLVETLGEERTSRLTVGALGPEALDRILRSRLSLGLPRPVLVQLHRASGGNPFYALEIGRAVQQGERRVAGEILPVPETLKGAVEAHLRELKPRTRAALGTVAALSRPTTSVVGTALGSRTSHAILTEAEDAGVVDVDGEAIRFSHPLLRSVLYREVSAEERQRIHRRLARIAGDAPERARHLALSVDGPDATVAAALDEGAEAAHARGAPEAAAALKQEALRLTPPRQRADARRRMVEAADLLLEAGDTARARQLLEEAVGAAGRGPERARALIPLAWVRSYQEGFPDALDLFVQARAEAGDNPAVKAEAEQGLAWCFHVRDVRTALKYARSSLENARASGDQAVISEAEAVERLILALSGRQVSLEGLERAMPADERATPIRPLIRPAWILSLLLQWVGDLHTARDHLLLLRQRATDRGDEHALLFVLQLLSRVECRLGNWEEAARLATESHGLALQTGLENAQLKAASSVSFQLYSQALVHACMGNVESALAAAKQGLELAPQGSSSIFELHGVIGFLELSRGRVREAHEHLAPIVQALESAGVHEPGVFRVHADEIEALIELGALGEAEALLAPFEARARARGHAWAVPLAGRCRGLVLAAQGKTDEALLRVAAALRDHERLPEPFELGRTLYAKGLVERRTKKKREARASLEGALTIFDGLGARLWAERARTELGRIGGRAPTPLSLTPTEERVAVLVSTGSANREVAAALFMSVNTVEANLKRIYRKLGITSRTQLAARMQQAGAKTGA